MNKIFTTKKIATFGIAIALWVVISSFLHIPIGIGHLWIDAGYVVYGLMLALFGPAATIIGVLGVFLENVLFTGWISFSWMAGQLVIGIISGIMFTKFKNQFLIIGVTIAGALLGIGLIKTLIEIALGYGVFEVKIVTNSIAAILDVIPLLVGYYLAEVPAVRKIAE